MNIDHKVAQLLVSRVCHDLAGGVSALSTGAELLSEDNQMADDEALSVIAMSATQCASRLAFFRVAFGLGGGESDTITTDELKALVEAYLQGGRVSLTWAARNVRIGLMPGKLLLNLCLIGAESLPRGGALRIDVTQIDRLENDGPENDGPENARPENARPENARPENAGPENAGPENEGHLGFAVSAQGVGAGLRPELQTALAVGVATDLLTARTVNGHFAAILAESLGAEMEILAEDQGEIRLAALM